MDKSDITAGQLADKLRTNPDTLRKRWSRTFPGQPFNLSAPLSAQEVQALSAGRGATKRGKKKPIVRPDIPDSQTPTQPAAPASLFNSMYLKAIVYGHALLILVDLTILYALPGAIAGVLSGLFMHSAIRLADRPELIRTSGFAVVVCLLMDALAWFVHVPAFRDSVSAEVSDTVTQVLAAVVCAISAAALWAIRDSQLD